MTIPAERFEVFSLLEDQTISIRQIFRTVFGDPELTTLRDEIMIVALDEALYEEYGSFPFRRTDLGKIAEVLSGFGARVVGLDFLMDFKSSYGEDEPTAEMLRSADNVLLVSYANFEDEKFTGLSYPTEILNETSMTGYTNLEPTSAIVDSLGRLRIHKDITNNKDGWPYAELADYLVELANANGGRDNVSVILIHVAKPYPIEPRGGLLERIVSWFE